MTFLKSTVLCGLLLTLLACGTDSPDPTKSDDDDAAAQADDGDDGTAADDGDSTGGTSQDSGSTSGARDAGIPSSAAKDAGSSSSATRDSGASTSAPRDAGATQSSDAGKSLDSADLGKDAGGGGFTFPDLFPAAADAGASPTTTSDGGTRTRDVNGPCKDLELLCIDPFDMFIFNPSDCFTCNGGKGCQGCAIPFAY